MEGVIVPTLVPPALSSLSSVSSDRGTLRKSLSRKSSLKSILSVTNCTVLQESVHATNVTDRSDSQDIATAVLQCNNTTPSFNIDSLLPSLAKEHSTTGSMDVDDYCAIDKPSSAVLSPIRDGDVLKDSATVSEDNHDIVTAKDTTGTQHTMAEENGSPAVELSLSNGEPVDASPKQSDELSRDSADVEETTEDPIPTEVKNNENTEADACEMEIDTAEPSDVPSKPSSSIAPKATPLATGQETFGPPPIEILISFDTTGSMSYYLDEVKNEINNIIHRLFMDIPNLKIGVIAHGDYCDASVYYLTQTMDLTSNVEGLCEMVKNVEGTGGGDFEECYELIMRMARQVKWTPGSQRALVMIGDACPHTPDSLTEMGKEPIDWKVEAAALKYEMVRQALF